jgi:chromosomal replication initiation ATPase DnaA
MTDLNQLIIKFDYEKNFKDDDFYVSKSNKTVFETLSNWPKWEKNFLNISGDRYSGKTHLINIFLKKFKGIKLNANSLSDEDITKLRFMKI